MGQVYIVPSGADSEVFAFPVARNFPGSAENFAKQPEEQK
jgi:hypothetical protein